MNLADRLLETAARDPAHLAVVGLGLPDVTYGQLRDAVEAAAASLRALGVSPGDCVGLHVPSGLACIVQTYAVWRCGGCVVPIPAELVPAEKARIVREIGVLWVLSDTRSLGALGDAVTGGREVVAGISLARVAAPRPHPPGFAAVDAAFVRFTSGTTGASKGVVLSHRTILERVEAANRVLALGPDDRVVWLLSMSYHFAVSIVAYVTFGATIVLCKAQFGATILEGAARFGGTIVYGAPMHYQLMAACEAPPGALSRLRLAISTTAKLRDETVAAFHARFGVAIGQALGIIEVGLPCINVDRGLDKPGSVGRVGPAYELDLRDVGLGDDLRAVRLRGPGLFDAYYDPWRPRDEVTDDGWFATGDLGSVDADGYLTLRGRSKELINVAGMKIFPDQVERVLDAHPGVRESQVYGEPHPLYGEVPHARVVLDRGAPGGPPTEEDLKRHCAERVAPISVPARITFVDALDRTASGKILRHRGPT